MRIKTNRYFYELILFFILSMVFYVWLINSPYFPVLYLWSTQHILLFALCLFLIKVAAIVYPPLPGGIATLAAIPILGWQIAYLIDFLGSMVGSSFAYFIARKYGYRFLTKIFDLNTIQKIKNIKVYPDREIESVFMLRVLLGTTILEALCYGAGLLNIKYRNFLIGSILSHIAVGVPTFFLASNLINLRNLPLTFIIVIIGILIFWKLKDRYFKFEN